MSALFLTGIVEHFGHGDRVGGQIPACLPAAGDLGEVPSQPPIDLVRGVAGFEKALDRRAAEYRTTRTDIE
ncbi:hypothetical protein M2302_005948 [Micromonospora sp. A200]|uniref:hypothetical protein n=1 Tax=Micromonospora sp. A200 TaxID=2940568 RepID=UPI0024730CF8|nr:hypothetical protein [Micromonospora sp. A200]MDH6465746.1 hypothetical protein [Micromonospora sp. A200]